jgi:hypothetical protein
MTFYVALVNMHTHGDLLRFCKDGQSLSITRVLSSYTNDNSVHNRTLAIDVLLLSVTR